MQKVRADGIAVGVSIRGSTVFGASGTVDGAVVDCDTVMYGASVAKQFTGFLVAQAVESGHLGADDPLSRWLPELPEWIAEIRLRHLLPTSKCWRGAKASPPGTVGDGGLWTTARDLITWLGASNSDLPEPAVVHRVEAPGYLDDGTPLSYAWGVRVTASPAGRQITHGGSWAGWLAKTVRLPEQRIAVAVLSTGGEEDEISRLGTDLAERLVEI